MSNNNVQGGLRADVNFDTLLGAYCESDHFDHAACHAAMFDYIDAHIAQRVAVADAPELVHGELPIVREFQEWLNEQRMKDVSEAFHGIVAKFRSVAVRLYAAPTASTPQHSPAPAEAVKPVGSIRSEVFDTLLDSYVNREIEHRQERGSWDDAHAAHNALVAHIDATQPASTPPAPTVARQYCRTCDMDVTKPCDAADCRAPDVRTSPTLIGTNSPFMPHTLTGATGQKHGITPASQIQWDANNRRAACELPPEGWYCTRAPAHDGPCAAHQKGDEAGPHSVLSMAIREDSRQFEKHWGRKFVCTPSAAHPWGWRYADDDVQEKFRKFCNNRVDAPATLIAAPNVQDAANRWNALLNSARIRMLGSAGLMRPEANNYAHFGMEIWTKYGTSLSPKSHEEMVRGNVMAREWLVKYTDVAMAAQKEIPTPPQ